MKPPLPRPLPAPLPLADAQSRLLALATPFSTEMVPVDAALNRYLAGPVIARRTQPPADLSAMDGYAISGDGPWQLVGESRAGAPFGGTVRNGEGAQISTGAMVPPGSDRILIQESAAADGTTIRLAGDMPSGGQHIRRAGFDFAQGHTLLETGTLIGPAQIALILSAGHGTVEVGRTPIVTIIDTGDELASDPAHCTPHQIPASNGAMLAAMAAQMPCSINRLGPIPDNLESLGGAFRQAEGSDLIVTSGGASVGDHDLIRPALLNWGAEIDFWRIAVKPGKPLLVAVRGKTLILGLPGNPVSSFTAAYLFMLPLLRHLSGATSPLPLPIWRPTLTDLPATGVRREFLRAWHDERGVMAGGQTDSSALRSLAGADCLIERPENTQEVKAGTSVPVYLLRNG